MPLLRCAGVPFRIGEVCAAEPLLAAFAELLRADIARFIHARDSLAKLFLRLYGGWVHDFLHGTLDGAGRKGNQRPGSTTPTLSTPLQAIYTRPSEVAAIFRTVPQPKE